MIFSAELADKVLAGTKTQTRRRMSDNPRSPWYRLACGIHEGQDYAVQRGRGETSIARILIDDVHSELLRDVTDADAQAEGGFQDAEHFLAEFCSINRLALDNGTLHEPVWVISFTLLHGPRGDS